MSAESELRTAAWNLPEGFDTMKNVAFAAADELSMATRQIIRDTELMRQDEREREQLRKDNAQYIEQLREVERMMSRIWEMADNGTSSIDIDPSSPLWQIEADTRAWIDSQYNAALMAAQKKIAELLGQVKFEKFWHEDSYLQREGQLKRARQIMQAIDNSGADSQLCDISVRSPDNIHGVWICDAVSQWIDDDVRSLLPHSPAAPVSDGQDDSLSV